MNKLNLFQIATKELSQDAFFTWLIQWADPSNEKYDKELSITAKKFVKLLTNEKIDIRNVLVRRQWKNIDICVEINDDIFIAIEDKTNSGEHSNQLERYKKIVQGHYNDKRSNLFFVYLKTGNESISTINKVIKKGYSVIDRKAILEIFDSSKSKNDILIEFKEYLRLIENQTNSFNKLDKIISNWRTAEGFYLKLQEMILPEFSDWGYVANQMGGFLGFWYHWTSYKDYRLYIQIENAFNNGIKLTVKISDWDQNLNKLYSVFSKLQKVGSRYNLKLIKPDRYRTGATSTLAIVENAFQSTPDGIFDINNFYEVLKKLEMLLDTYSTN